MYLLVSLTLRAQTTTRNRLRPEEIERCEILSQQAQCQTERTYENRFLHSTMRLLFTTGNICCFQRHSNFHSVCLCRFRLARQMRSSRVQNRGFSRLRRSFVRLPASTKTSGACLISRSVKGCPLSTTISTNLIDKLACLSSARIEHIFSPGC